MKDYQEIQKATRFIQDLKDRGLIHSHTNEQALIGLLASGKKTYMGIDPTADFLHLGHYVGLSVLKRFMKKGYPVVLVIGSLTAKIGDPSFRSSSRKFNPDIEHNAKRIREQLERFFERESHSSEISSTKSLFELVDNYQFHNDRFAGDVLIQKQPVDVLLNFIDDVCSKLKVSELSKKQFLVDRWGHGLTLSELLYSGLQGWDFLYLYKEKQVAIQIGGSDQWGNMLVGLELIFKSLYGDIDEENNSDHEFWKAGVITFPIITDAHGNKFGKSEGNAISIDDSEIEKNVYLIRQYFLNVRDDLVRDYFLKFTYLDEAEITQVINKGYQEAKHKLSDCICKDIFGHNNTLDSSSVTAADMFVGLNHGHTYETIMNKFKNALPFYSCVWHKDLYLSSIFEALKLVSSKSEFNRLVKSKGIYVINVPSSALENSLYRVQEEYVIWKDSSQKEGVLMVRKGKKQFGLVHFTKVEESEEDFKNMALPSNS